jgi:putative transcriptional regulator
VNPSLTGELLVATPVIEGGLFQRSVILVVDHNEDGALGVILNLPSRLPLGEVLPAWQELAVEPAVLFQGGPVGQESALAVARVPITAGDSAELRRFAPEFALVDLDADPDELDAIAGIRAFIGYSGWSAGQLEEEIDEGSWFVVPALGEDLVAPIDSLYQRVLRRSGGVAALHSTYLVDPSLN